MTHKFLPALDIEHVRALNRRAWQYSNIRPRVTPLPSSYMNPRDVAGRDQRDRGTCVGQSNACMMDYLHILGSGEVQSGTVVRDLTTTDGIVHDQLPIQAMSAECIYQEARAIEPGLDGEGAYIHDAITQLSKVGICLESQWYTGKTEAGIYVIPSPATAAQVAAECVKHKLSGYASVTTLDELKQALVDHTVCVGAINVFSSYASLGYLTNGLHNGHFPDPSPGDSVIGGHALCYIGYDDSKSLLYFRHSWAGWELVGSISYGYWNKYGSDFWTGIDVGEVDIGNTIHKDVQITASNCSTCTITVMDGSNVVTKGVGPFTVNLIVGKQYNIILTTTTGIVQSQTVSINDTTVTIDSVVEIPSGMGWLTILTVLISKIFGK